MQYNTYINIHNVACVISINYNNKRIAIQTSVFSDIGLIFLFHLLKNSKVDINTTI